MSKTAAGLRLALVSLGISALASCATSEDETDRPRPGGLVDGGGTGGTGGTGGASATGGQAGVATADAATDSSLDAGSDASDDASSAGDAQPDSPMDGALEASGDANGGDATDGSDAATPGRQLLIASTASALLLGHRQGSTWTTASQNISVEGRPAVVAGAWGGLSVVRRKTTNELSYSSWSPVSETWSSFGVVAAGGTTLGTPALAADPTDAHLAFIGTDFKFYANRYTSTGWNGSFSPVSSQAVQSFGPAAPGLAARATVRSLAFEGNDGDLYTQQESSGAYQAAHPHQLLVKPKTGLTPAIVARDGSSQFVVAYVETGTNQVLVSEGSATSWSSPAAVTGAFAQDTPALLALPGGDVLLALRDLTGALRVARLSGSSWSSVTGPLPGLTLGAAPALAPGLVGEATVALVAGGAAQVSELVAGKWTTPTPVFANSVLGVALATYQP